MIPKRGWAPALAGVALAIVGDGCNIAFGGSCQTVHQDRLAFDSVTGTGTIARDDLWPVVGQDPPPDGTCHTQLEFQPAPCGWGADTQPYLDLVLSCTDHGKKDALGLRVRLNDVRYYSTGDYPLDVTPFGALPYPITTSVLHVVSASGSAAPFPRIVTPDFERVFRFELVAGTLTATLDYDVTADRFTAEPGKACEECQE